SRDCSSRADGTPATFQFNCDFPPTVDSVTVTPVNAIPYQGTVAEPSQLITWQGLDLEDGLTEDADVKIDDTLTFQLRGRPDAPFQSVIISNRTFFAQSPGSTQSVKVKVFDRAGLPSPNEVRVEFQIPSPSP